MNILILGSGGREHAIAWAVKQNPKCDRLIVAPGNAGIATIAECADIDILDGDAVAVFAEENTVDFVLVGPEAPLAAGVADRLRDAGLSVFGPSAAAARLEASKSFTKAICDAAKAPTAAYARFTEAEGAKAYIRAQGAPIVVKADGLAAGKGVIVAMTETEALDAIDDMFGGEFGTAGAEVVIEEFMEGEEGSLFVLVDGETVVPIGTAQDHKRVGDGDTGPNTGGMGAYSPAPVLTDEIAQKALDQIVQEEILTLLMKLQKETNVSYLFITHDIATVRAISDEIVVMHQGKVVQQGPKTQVLNPPHPPYTELLLSSVPQMDPDWLTNLLADRARAKVKA